MGAQQHFTLLQFLVVILEIVGSLGAEITTTIRGYTYKYIQYNVKEATSIRFTVRGPKDAHIGLFADIKSTFKYEPFYEFVIGAYSNRKVIFRKSGRGTEVKLKSNFKGFLQPTKFSPFWISWANHNFALGYGRVIGAQVIISHDDSAAPMDVNYIAFGSYMFTTVTFKYFNVELDHETLQCKPKLPLLMAPVHANDVINDGKDDTCVQVSTTQPSIFMQLMIHDQLPLKVKLQLKSVPSCEKANIVVFSRSTLECPLLTDGLENGMVSCVYNCVDETTKVSIGFVQHVDRPQVWSLCEVATA